MPHHRSSRRPRFRESLAFGWLLMLVAGVLMWAAIFALGWLVLAMLAELAARGWF